MPVLFSVITPSFGTSGEAAARYSRFLVEAYRSLRAQTVQDWEWIVSTPGEPLPEALAFDAQSVDNRVRTITQASRDIGFLKRGLCEEARAPFIVELDHDDLLAPDALAEIGEALQRADFVYSDFAEFNDETWEPGVPYRADCGWKTYPVEFQGHRLLAHRAPPVTAQNIRLVDWAPNHVRAWRQDAYDDVGGHDRGLRVGDDHDLICRFYLAGKRFAHIAKCLYFYRLHEGNAVKRLNEAIRNQTWANYNRYIWPLADEWARRSSLKQVDLCGGLDSPGGFEIWDRSIPSGSRGTPCDLESTWPAQDSSVGLIRAEDAVEHLRDPVHTMSEAYRVLAPGGFFLISVPSTNGLGAFCDPTHRSFWNRLSFRYYTDARFARYVPEFKGRFQQIKLIEWFPSPWHRDNNVPYVEAHLVALKPGYEPMGEVLI